MPQTVIGQEHLIAVDTIATMLFALAHPKVEKDNVDWRGSAKRAMAYAMADARKSAGTIVSAEAIATKIFNMALDERARLAKNLTPLTASVIYADE